MEHRAWRVRLPLTLCSMRHAPCTMQKSWRLLPLEKNNPYWNMAVDEAVLISQSRESLAPTLRFYTWDPPSVSLGYFQKITEEDKKKWKKLKIPVVRRLSGGRAVFHNHDLTYSFIIRENLNLLPKNISASCNLIGECLCRGLKSFGIDQKLTEVNNTLTLNIKNKNCFNIFSKGEILINKRKLVGSAQVRKKGVILQHGSILMNDLPVWENTDPSKMITLKEILGREIRSEEIIPFIVSGFESVFNSKFEAGCLTDEEKVLAVDLENKYKEQQ
ncbi:MAG: biotin/lipoate A/B protein ligase family protein [bacterium]|nr:biotin/lipoate A/B protein ligase family protein [bacterium]